MPRQPGGKHVLDFTEDPVKELKGVSVRQSHHDLLDKYVLYVQSDGKAKPTRSVVADKIFEYFFAKDTGFQAFLKSSKVKPAQQSEPAGQS